MKKWIFSICLLFGILLVGRTLAQTVRAVPASAGQTVSGNSVIYNLPQTVVTVEFVLQHETIKRGPYARFAQKLLGTVAPLSDKEMYTILGVSVTYASEADPSAAYILENPNKALFDLYYPTPEGFLANDGQSEPRFGSLGGDRTPAISTPEGFDGLLVDKWNSGEPALEEAAAEAARTLFTLRKRRFDLVTGEAGENVYGAGMQAALDEMRRLEDEYTALFMGKRTVNRIVRRVDVVPELGKNTLIVSRFSESGGLLPDNDLTGRPIVLELTPERKTESTVLPRAAGRDSRGTIYMRSADIVRFRLVDDKNVLLTGRMPIYQFGQVVEVPVTSVK